MAATMERIQIPVFSLCNIKHFMDAWTEYFCVYKGVLVFFDEDKDTRIFDFLDSMSDDYRDRLFAVGERKAGLSMVWKGTIPKQYQEESEIDVRGDTWTVCEVHRFLECSPASRLVKPPFIKVDQKVCVVRGDTYMIRRWLSQVGFAFDKEAKAWMQTVDVDAMGRGLFRFKYSNKQIAWDLSEFIDECPDWDERRKLTVAFE